MESTNTTRQSEDRGVSMGWPHAPAHIFKPGMAVMVTAGTYMKELFFKSPQRLSFLEHTIFEQTAKIGWQLQAWAVMANHYHFVGQGVIHQETLKSLLGAIHSITARQINAEDNTPGRKVWFQYWDSTITHEKSYFARLSYVHNNPVKHGLVTVAEFYPWCSMRWLIGKADRAYRKTVLSFKTDKLKIRDDFD